MTIPYPIHSEEIEPFAAMWIGRMFARCEHVKENSSAYDPYAYYDALHNLWYGLYGLERIAISSKTATHFSVAMNNHIVFISGYIKDELGLDPTTEPGWKW